MLDENKTDLFAKTWSRAMAAAVWLLPVPGGPVTVTKGSFLTCCFISLCVGDKGKASKLCSNLGSLSTK